jgi:hypothetical protein
MSDLGIAKGKQSLRQHPRTQVLAESWPPISGIANTSSPTSSAGLSHPKEALKIKVLVLATFTPQLHQLASRKWQFPSTLLLSVRAEFTSQHHTASITATETNQI